MICQTLSLQICNYWEGMLSIRVTALLNSSRRGEWLRAIETMELPMESWSHGDCFTERETESTSLSLWFTDRHPRRRKTKGSLRFKASSSSHRATGTSPRCYAYWYEAIPQPFLTLHERVWIGRLSKKKKKKTTIEMITCHTHFIVHCSIDD